MLHYIPIVMTVLATYIIPSIMESALWIKVCEKGSEGHGPAYCEF